MYLYFADDTRQPKPTVADMGPMVGMGALGVEADRVRKLTAQTDALCDKYGFPSGAEFKWSPGRELWMHRGLVGADREGFFLALVELVQEAGAVLFFVCEDTYHSPAIEGLGAGQDVVTLALERVNEHARRRGGNAIVIADTPGGGRRDERQFLEQCHGVLRAGTRYVKFDRIVGNVLTAPSSLGRLLQTADVFAGCCLARIAGEDRYSPRVFDRMRELFDGWPERAHGIGLKIHPDFLYGNLYHWLLGADIFRRGNMGWPLPMGDRPYAQNPYPACELDGGDNAPGSPAG